MQKKRIAVLFGGKSSEHEVSGVSAAYVIRQIPAESYEVFPIGITKTGKWFLFSGPTEAIKNGSWEQDPHNLTAFISPDPSVGGLVVMEDGKARVEQIDGVFPVLHGKNGEDGTVQGLLELAGLPYVGCGVLGSACCMDKIVTNCLLEQAGIRQAAFTYFSSYAFRSDPEACLDQVERELKGYPVFVKPANAGSSVGVSKAADRASLKTAILAAAKEDRRILVEECIIGQEVECAVLGNERPFASIPGEIAPAAEFYDYEAKYHSASSQLFIPAHISEELREQVRTIALKAYAALDCSGLSRVDFFVTPAGEVLLNEINTLPGFTSISMYPKLMAACGHEGSRLIEELLELSFERADSHV